MNQLISKAAALSCAGALALTVLGGCAQQQAAQQNAQQDENRAYMAQVNQTMETLDDRLSSFSDAVSRSDLVTMRTQADNAFKCIDDLSAIDAPDDLADIKSAYVDGTSELRSALDAYIALYTEIESATDDAPFDWSTYDARLSEIKTSYDEGIAKLQEGDQKAADLGQDGQSDNQDNGQNS